MHLDFWLALTVSLDNIRQLSDRSTNTVGPTEKQTKQTPLREDKGAPRGLSQAGAEPEALAAQLLCIQAAGDRTAGGPVPLRFRLCHWWTV